MLKIDINIVWFAFANVLKFGLKILSVTFAIQNREVEQSAATDLAHIRRGEQKVGERLKEDY